MDTPYRLSKVLADVVKAFGRSQRIFLACDLTMPTERFYLGEAQKVAEESQNRKAEFILVVDKPERRR